MATTRHMQPHIENIYELEDILPNECITEICTQGSNYEATSTWLMLCPFKMLKSDAINQLSSQGGWKRSDLKRETLTQLKEKILWCAAWNVYENHNN